MNVLGINAFHGDSSAVLLKAGSFHAGIEEERLNRIKHWAGFPARAIGTVLAMGGISLDDVADVAVSRDPKAHLIEKALFTFKHRPGLEAIRSRLQNHGRVASLESLLASLGTNGPYRGRIH